MTDYRKPLALRHQIDQWKDDPRAPAEMNEGANNANKGYVQRMIPFIGAQESRDRGVDKGYNRHLVFGYLFCDLAEPFRPMRSSDLTPGHWFALARWIAAEKDNDGKWKPQPAFKRECKWVFNIADYCMARTEEESDLPFGALLAEDLDQSLPASDLDDSFVSEIINVGHEFTDRSDKKETGEWSGDPPIRLDADPRPVQQEKKPLSESLLIPEEWL